METENGGSVGQRQVLGKGLASLFPGMANIPVSPPANADSVASGIASSIESSESNRGCHPGISLANVEDIKLNNYQPRRDFNETTIEELAESIKANGIIQPLIVRKNQTGYQLIAGERRLRAAKVAGLKQVPVVIRRSTDKEALELALIENIQREDLNCIDEALAYFKLINEFYLTQEEVAKQVGKDRATVANYLRLVRLPDVVIQDLKQRTLSFGHGKALLGIEDNELKLMIRAEVLEKGLSVRETEALVEEYKINPPKKISGSADTEAAAKASAHAGKTKEIRARLEALSQDLTRSFAAKVVVRGTERRGKIVIHYACREELDRLLETMQTHKSEV